MLPLLVHVPVVQPVLGRITTSTKRARQLVATGPYRLQHKVVLRLVIKLLVLVLFWLRLQAILIRVVVLVRTDGQLIKKKR